jgi:hypothetical protein
MIDAGSCMLHPSAGGQRRFTGYAFSMRLPFACVALCALLVAACGGSGGSGTTSTADFSSPAPAVGNGPSLSSLLGLPESKQIDTPDVLVTSGADYAAGKEMRVPVGLLHKDGAQFLADGGKIEIYLARDGASGSIGPFEATYTPIEGPGIKLAPQDIKGVYVAQVKLPKAGGYFMAAKYTAGGKGSTASGSINVGTTEATPPVGAEALPSDTPTIKSTGGDFKALTTADPPDKTLLQYSIAESLKAKKPFVAVFATPKYCSSRLCGPTVKLIEAVQKNMKGTPMRFIHVEIYQGNDPNSGPNPWVVQWALPTEPWIFVVGADGKIRAKFEGAVGLNEVEQAARAALS